MSKFSADVIERNTGPVKKFNASRGAGAVDEDTFQQSFVPDISITAYSAKELGEIMGRVKDNLGVAAEEWEKRVNALKTLRALVSNGATQFDEFMTLLRLLEDPVDSCVRDLRSSVVREACITVAYLSQELRNKFDHFSETVLQNLILLLSNSAKIMSSSGLIAMRYILQNTYSSKLLQILLASLSSKSNVTRKHICESIELVITHWPVNILEKQIGPLQDALKRGISDADQDARLFSRRAFTPFVSKFPTQGQKLLISLDAQKRKLIERDLTNAGVNAAASVSTDTNGTSRSRSNSQTNLVSSTRGTVNSATGTSVTRRPNRPALGTSASNDAGNGSCSRPPITRQSDLNAIGRYVRQNSLFNPPSRTSGRSKVSQSQPTSREASPKRFGLLYTDNEEKAYNPLGYLDPNGTDAARSKLEPLKRPAQLSRVPRSQCTSREASPTRSLVGGTSNIPYQQSFSRPTNASLRYRQRPTYSTMSDCGDMDFSLTRTIDKHVLGSDDETSSQCSDRSRLSMPGSRKGSTTKSTNNFKEIIALLYAAHWSDRKDGLMNLQNYMRSGVQLGPDDIRRVTEVFGKMFSDSHSQVVSLFMDTLQYFIKEYNMELRDWLSTLLFRLITRQSNYVLESHQRASKETLLVIRSHFPLNVQFVTCCRLIVDNSVAQNFKFRVQLLEYMKDLMLMMSPDSISSSNEVNTAVSRIISWSAEPKSADVRRMASRVIIKLFDLNPNGFAAVLRMLPQPVQDRASDILKTYEKTTGSSGAVSSVQEGNHGARYRSGTSFARTGSLRKLQQPMFTRSYSVSSAGQHSQITPPSLTKPYQHSVSYSGRTSPDTVDNAIRHTTEVLQSLTLGNPPSTGVPLRRVSEGAAPNRCAFQSGEPNGTDGVLRPMQSNFSYTSPSVSESDMATPSAVSNCYSAPYSPLSDSLNQPTPCRVTKTGGLSGTDHVDSSRLRKPVIGYQTLKKIREFPPEDIMAEILQELSNHNERHEQRKACMLKLIKLLRDGVINDWTDYFKPTLLILLETLGDDRNETRALSLRVLEELVRMKPDLVHAFAHLFVIKVLEACRDEDKMVIHAAEGCAMVAAQSLPPDLCFSVLTPLIDDWKMLAAVKMQAQVVRNSSVELILSTVKMLVPGLIMGCNHEDSAMRKASIFCLVDIALKIGDSIWDYLTDLATSKQRLLKLYISRHQGNQSSVDSAADNRVQ